VVGSKIDTVFTEIRLTIKSAEQIKNKQELNTKKNNKIESRRHHLINQTKVNEPFNIKTARDVLEKRNMLKWKTRKTIVSCFPTV